MNLQIISKEGGLLLKENFEGGATWAFEVGSQSMVCPIIVEDLNPPRQMLVEVVTAKYIKDKSFLLLSIFKNLYCFDLLQMLCEERGFFLEIADIIRALGLTILNGVMEARNDKIWARFVVEVILSGVNLTLLVGLFSVLKVRMFQSSSAIIITIFKLY